MSGKRNSGKTNIKCKTGMFSELTDLAQERIAVSSTPEEKNVVKKIYDAIRYSHMVSCEETVEDDILLLVEKRKNKCRASKRKM